MEVRWNGLCHCGGNGSYIELTTEPNTAIINGFQDSRTVRELHDLKS